MSGSSVVLAYVAVALILTHRRPILVMSSPQEVLQLFTQVCHHVLNYRLHLKERIIIANCVIIVEHNQGDVLKIDGFKVAVCSLYKCA